MRSPSHSSESIPAVRFVEFNRASVATAIAAIKSMFRWLEKASLVMENPAAAVSVPTPPATEGKNLEPFQVESLFQALESRPKTDRCDLAIRFLETKGESERQPMSLEELSRF